MDFASNSIKFVLRHKILEPAEMWREELRQECGAFGDSEEEIQHMEKR